MIERHVLGEHRLLTGKHLVTDELRHLVVGLLAGAAVAVDDCRLDREVRRQEDRDRRRVCQSGEVPRS